MHQEHIHLTQAERLILMKLSDILTINQGLVGQLSKIEAEVVTKFADLQTTIDKLLIDLADAPLTEAQANSVNDVLAAVQRLDDIVPDVIPEPSIDTPA